MGLRSIVDSFVGEGAMASALGELGASRLRRAGWYREYAGYDCGVKKKSLNEG